MLVVHATFPIDPDRREEALEAATTLAEHSRVEDGIIDYRVAIDADDPNLLRFFEQYEDEAAFGAHSETEHFGEFAAVLPELLAGEPDVVRFDVSEATELEL
ncbi:MAG: putative quinol monooxygenase [Haloarculaceae archaeon]